MDVPFKGFMCVGEGFSVSLMLMSGVLSGHDVIIQEPWFYVGCGPGDVILYLILVMLILWVWVFYHHPSCDACGSVVMACVGLHNDGCCHGGGVGG